MPIDDARPFLPVRIAVLTVSDSRSLSEDKSGDALVERIDAAGHVTDAKKQAYAQAFGGHGERVTRTDLCGLLAEQLGPDAELAVALQRGGLDVDAAELVDHGEDRGKSGHHVIVVAVIDGDTIRVSLSAPPVEEVKVGTQILQALNLRPRKLEIVSCPSCGRAQVDVYKLAEEVTAGLEGMEFPIRVAVMGCVVNGPGEARDADLGVASGNGKGQIFVKGEVVRTVPEDKIVETLIEEAMRIADEEGLEAVDGAKADVRVTQ